MIAECTISQGKLWVSYPGCSDPVFYLNWFDLAYISTILTSIDPCDDKVCLLPGSYCESRGRVAKCRCRGCQGEERDPVCGQVGDADAKTFVNFCQLMRTACLANSTFIKIHDGNCDGM